MRSPTSSAASCGRRSPGATYRDIFERAAAQVTAANDRQHPQMEGRADREIFGVKDIEPMRFVTVAARKDDTVTVDAGAALGMTVGSTWSVHPQGTKSADAGAALGEIEITAVRGITSEARVKTESAAGVIVAGSRAFETEHAYGELRMRVQMAPAPGHDADIASFRAALDASPLLESVDDVGSAAVRVYLVALREAVGDGDPVPQLGKVDAPVWAGVKEDGQLTMPPKPVGDIGAVIRNLETLARYRQALALENPDPASRLRGKFEVVLLRKAADGSWTPAKPDAESGQVVFEEGESIAFRVVADADRDPERDPAFLNLLYFGASGSISMAWTPGAKEKIAPGISFDIGTRDEDFELYLPDAFPFADGPGGGVTAATEVVKLIVTGGPADFSFVEQQGMRGAAERKDVSPLMMLFETATQGSPTRELRRRPVKQEDWTTVVVPILLRRKQTGALKADGQALDLGGAVLVTPGLEGQVRTHAWNSDRATAADLQTDALGAALGSAGIDVRQTVEISAAREVGPGTRSARGDAMELRLSDPGAGYGQMVMSTDESGVVSWHFAAPPAQGPEGSRGAAGPSSRSYLIPRAVPSDAPAAPGQRGLVGAVGRKFLKELVFPLIDPVLGAVSESFAARWEAKHRPYRVRPFGPDDYTSADTPALDGEGWRRIGGGRALLFVHGTFSRAHTAFSALPKEWVGTLHEKYGGRVFALDHYTLSHDPRQNVNWFFEQQPDGVALDLDIVCHSRGGLVSRLLSEKLAELNVGSRDVRIGSIVFVGAPNAGTILTNTDRIGDLIDTWTNILNFIPDAGASDVIAAIVTVAKQLAVGAVGGLKGLQSMRPGGDFAKWLNAGPRAGDTRYFALTSDYTPGEPGLRDFAKNRLMDTIFKGPNDLVVPTDGVYAENGSGFFPIEDRVVFTGTDAVAHTDFFSHRIVRDRIREWLGA